MSHAPDARAVVVTGGSSGIGRASVSRLVQEGVHVFATGLTVAESESLAAEFGDRITPLVVDVTDESSVLAAAQRVDTWLAGRTLFGLVNNAGMAIGGPLAHLETKELRLQMETNYLGVHTVTRAFLGMLGVDRARTGEPGRLVMMSSTSGRDAAPFMGPYVASKHALEGYSQSLRRELMLHGIKVIVIAPGLIATPIWDKAEDEGHDRFADTPYAAADKAMSMYLVAHGRRGLPPSAVASAVWTALSAPNPRQRVTVMRRKFMEYTLPRLFPDAVMDGLIAKMFGLIRK